MDLIERTKFPFWRASKIEVVPCPWCERPIEDGETHGVFGDETADRLPVVTCTVKVIVHYPTKVFRLESI